MALEFKKARREQVRVKINIGGPAGSGKTMSSLLLGYGLIKAEHPEWSDAQVWDSICICDTECGSGSLYVGAQVGPTTIGEYNTIGLTPPFTAQSFMDAIHMAEQHQMMVIIIDSLSHVWGGEGGLLDEQGKIAARSGNSYTSWRTISPQYTKLVDTILQSSSHIITCARAKMEYQQIKSESTGKSQVKALGMGLELRSGYEYEVSVNFMLDNDHVANATKDRTGIFDGKYFVIDANTGKQLYAWLSSGAKPVDPPKPSVPEPVKASAVKAEAPSDADRVAKAIAAIDPLIVAAAKEDKEATKEKVMAIAGTANYKALTDLKVLTELYNAFKLQ